jgi:hypothetical protein
MVLGRHIFVAVSSWQAFLLIRNLIESGQEPTICES